MKVKDNHFLAKAIALSILCMVPVSTNAAGFSAITSGGVIDEPLDVNVTGHDSDDNGILLSGGNNLTINNGGTIRVNTVANASGITAADSFSGATNVTVNGAKFTIDVGYAKQGASAVGVWSQTMRNQVGTGDQPQPEYQGGKVTLNASENKINVTSNRVGYGLLSGSDFDGNSNQGGNIICNGKLDIDVNVLTPDGKNSDSYYFNRAMGVLAYGGNVYINNDADIHIKSQANGGNSKEVAGLYTSYDGHINGSADSTINIHAEGISKVTGITNGTYDVFAQMNNVSYTPSSINLRGTTNIFLDGKRNYGICSDIKSTFEANTVTINFTNDSKNLTSVGIQATDEGKIKIDNLFIGTDATALNQADKITALQTDKMYAGRFNITKNAQINVNTNEQGTVQINGSISNQEKGTINLHLTNADSYFYGNVDTSQEDSWGGRETNIVLKNGAVWKNFSANGWMDSNLTNFTLDNHARLDMTYNEYSSNKFFQNIYITNNMSGTNATINMDIDAGTNTDNSDRLYIAGTHTGNHYITLNNVNADGNTDGAAGTVLVSVKDEQGNFFANDKEGSLYWNKYTLDKQDSTTDGYNTDWYLKKVEFIPDKPTTSVDAVDATQRLAFANWVEDDKLMQRMGDLRHETNNEEGVWVRVKGGKYSGDGFSNRHTMYQLGYDDVVKNTDKLKRYQGVAFSYDDGKNNFNRGSGKLKAKSIGFYNTDLRNKGHYLDVVFKIYDADSDFTVFDSEGKKITGAFDNTGISLSAEYGRKKYLDEHWSVEPQAQLTLGYLGGARYTTSNGIYVSQSDPNSVLGRIGCNFMYDMDEKNTVYLKANWLHQFAGNYGVTLTNGNDSLRIDNHDHDTWFEYGLGFACMTGKNNHLYADVERSTGGSLRKNWQWNAGMFWTF
ncbi:autotransporter outer membrane beta-barrel domain-containing protein [uncultured Phascolarctobacterium sp.]|uniref:autotransporter family protein n=1 Tax=uncultured Phascolarctobacterium sp. TaxID=512296 RepID=UPI0027DBCDFE|nr:autotransporter outer membrane beta-barrel domain-containing protein [uncultured Phascolarctobacterium sp.]